MRKILVLALASTFLTAAPVDVKPVEAKSLFEALFPRAAERRRKRREQKRLRHLKKKASQKKALEKRKNAKKKVSKKKKKKRVAAVKTKKVSGPKYKTYFPRKIAAVRLVKMAKAFDVYDQKLMAAKNSNRAALSSGAIGEYPLGVRPQLVSEVTVVEEGEAENSAALRLSAGADLLKSIRLNARPALGKALVSHYKKNPSFLWTDDQGKPNARASAVLKVLEKADSYGLRTDDYALPALPAGEDEQNELRAAMQFEFAVSIAALRYMADAKNGVVDPNRISGYHDFSGLSVNYSKLLNKLANEEEVDVLMLSQHPKDPAFEGLKTELARLREKAIGHDGVTIKNGTFVRPGQNSDQISNIVESIRRKVSSDFIESHLSVFSSDHAGGEYTPEIIEMVKDFQRSVKLKPDGIIGKNTIARMAVADPKVQIQKVVYSMERLRWQPDSLGNAHVFINQPAYRATYMRNGKPQLSMRVVVGKQSNQTYFFHDKIEYVEFNPYWGIPKSILVNEMLPKLRKNSNYFDKLGYEITNVRGKKIASSKIDWWGVGSDFPYDVRQPPSSKNALGELKIMFPNSHSIYMHDTPAKSLFKRNKRAFSHGCVRLAEPRRMAAAVLGTDIDHVAGKLADGKNKQQRLKQSVPVYVSYFTAWPDSSGKMDYFADVYGRDKALAKAFAVEQKARARARGV